MKNSAAAFLMLVLSVVAACAPTAPTPTPKPTPTPIEVLATKAEHLAGIWYNSIGAQHGQGPYYRFDADRTVNRGFTLEELQENPFVEGRFWFEDGVYYEEGQLCEPIGSYRVYLQIEEGRAVGIRFEQIQDGDLDCYERSWPRRGRFVRVD